MVANSEETDQGENKEEKVVSWTHKQNKEKFGKASTSEEFLKNFFSDPERGLCTCMCVFASGRIEKPCLLRPFLPQFPVCIEFTQPW